MVEHVDSLGAELQFLAVRPGHGKVLENRHVHIPEPGAASDVPVAGTAAKRERERAESVSLARIVFDSRGTVYAHDVRMSTQVRLRSNEHRRGRLRKVDRERIRVNFVWEAGMRSKDTGHLPATDQLVHGARGIVSHPLTAAKWQSIFEIRSRHVARVEIRAAPANP